MKSKVINLYTYMEVYKDDEVFENYKYINNIESMQEQEYADVNEIASHIFNNIERQAGVETKKLSGYYLDKKVEIGFREQFDLLRFSNDSILNIELKSERIPDEEIKDQLIRHKFVLGCVDTEKEIYTFTYVSETKELFTISNESLTKVTIDILCNLISLDYLENNLLDDLDADSLIVSPYSDIKRFIDHRYFLNSEQKKIVQDILSTAKKVSMIKGGAGTGKTLVLFDLADKLTKLGSKVLLIFCSILENPIEIDNQVDFKFIHIKQLQSLTIENFDYILLDESQRLYEENYNRVIESPAKLIFCVDKAQTLKYEENSLNVEQKLENIVGVQKFDLKEKVRTDESLSTFILKLFEKDRNGLQPIEFPKVNAVYFDSVIRARYFIEVMERDENYESIEVASYKTKATGTTYNEKIKSDSKDGFTVIGREYENVIIPIDDRTIYIENKLVFRPTGFYYPYLGTNGIFQAITRVKKHLLFVVIKNKEIYTEIQELINWEKRRNLRRISNRLKLLRETNNSQFSDVAKVCKCLESTYKNIEETGKFPNNKILKRLSNFYNVSSNFLIGEPIELSMTEFDIVYQKKIKGMNKEQIVELNESLINFLND